MCASFINQYLNHCFTLVGFSHDTGQDREMERTKNLRSKTGHWYPPVFCSKSVPLPRWQLARILWGRRKDRQWLSRLEYILRSLIKITSGKLNVYTCLTWMKVICYDATRVQSEAKNQRRSNYNNKVTCDWSCDQIKCWLAFMKASLFQTYEFSMI